MTARTSDIAVCVSGSLAPLLKQDGVLDQVLTELAGEFAMEDFNHLMWIVFEQVKQVAWRESRASYSMSQGCLFRVWVKTYAQGFIGLSV